jgi:hypothetical protein
MSRSLPEGFGEAEDLVGLLEHSLKVRGSLRTRAYKYALSRGVTPAQVVDYKLSVKPLDGRLWFPVWDTGGTVHFRMGRVIGDDPGIKTIEEGDGSKPLYGSHVRSPSGFVALVEGVFDHFATPDSYATMGSHVSPSQLETMLGWQTTGQVRSFIGLYDPDAKDKARSQCLYLRKSGLNASVCFLEGTDADPAELGVGVMKQAIRWLRSFRPEQLQAMPFLTAQVKRSQAASGQRRASG